MNESKKGDLRMRDGMYKKWKDSGALAKHPEQYHREQRAELKIDPPEVGHQSFQIHFQSEGKTEEWKSAYAYTIIEMAKAKGWEPFFQSGSNTDTETWQMIELMKSNWLGLEQKDIEDFLEEVHEEVEKRNPDLFKQY
jgi:hypothetical protein